MGSQYGEDRIIARALEGVEHGFYADVGAGHPRYDSVSHSFYVRGWRGVLVEPNPELSRLLWHERPHDTVFTAAAGDGDGLRNLAVFEDGRWGLSTLDGSTRQQHERSGLRAALTPVTVLTLDRMLEFAGREAHLDFVSIDTEGYERNVLLGFDLRRWTPSLLIIEAVRPGTLEPCHADWEDVLAESGYWHAYSDPVNRYYTADRSVAARLGSNA